MQSMPPLEWQKSSELDLDSVQGLQLRCARLVKAFWKLHWILPPHKQKGYLMRMRRGSIYAPALHILKVLCLLTIVSHNSPTKHIGYSTNHRSQPQFCCGGHNSRSSLLSRRL